MFNEEIKQYFDKITKPVKKEIGTKHWAMLIYYATNGFPQTVKSISYAYKLGFKAGKRSKEN